MVDVKNLTNDTGEPPINDRRQNLTNYAGEPPSNDRRQKPSKL